MNRLACIAFLGLIYVSGTYAILTAVSTSPSDFAASCGNESTPGPLMITWSDTLSNGPNAVYIYGKASDANCTFTMTAGNVTAGTPNTWTLADAYNGGVLTTCGVAMEATTGTYEVTVVIQLGTLETSDDAFFQIQCQYSAAASISGNSTSVSVTDAIKDNTVQSSGAASNTPDRTYTLMLMDASTGSVATVPVALGMPVMLQAVVSGTDSGTNVANDEVSLQVKKCWASSGSASSVTFLNNYCPSFANELFADNTVGFTTASDSTMSPQFKMFGVAGGDGTVTFACDIAICRTACNGDNCDDTRRRRDLTAHRFRRSVFNESMEVRVVTAVTVGPPGWTNVGSGVSANTGNTSANTGSGMNTILIAVAAVMGILLIATMIGVIFMCMRMQNNQQQVPPPYAMQNQGFVKT